MDFPQFKFQINQSITLEYIDTHPSDKEREIIVLIHGFPQFNYQFRKVIPLLSEFRVVCPNYIGAAGSTKSYDMNDYKKGVQANYINQLVSALTSKKVHVVGHDIGGMIAHSYALHYPDSLKSVVWGECPIPGSTVYHKTKNEPVLWHFTFHNQFDLPEFLVQGREKQYLKHFYDRLAFNTNAISNSDLDVYATEFGQPGSMRAGFNQYRAFEIDGKENYSVLEKGLSKVPCLALFGKESFQDDEAMKSMCGESFEKFELQSIENAGHWIAEENPEGFADALKCWINKSN